MTKDKKNNFKDHFLTFIATGAYLGKIPFAPGTWGSLLGVLMWISLSWVLNWLAFSSLKIEIFWASFITITFIFGLWAANFYGKKTKIEDNKEIVIDEIFGQIITFFIAGLFIDINNSWLLIFLSFVFFRFFDITKPFIIGLADKNVKGGFGVMLDDFLAGFAAAALLYGFWAFTQ